MRPPAFAPDAPAGHGEGSDACLVCCVLPRGEGTDLQTRLWRELGVTRVDVHPARAFMGSDPRGLFNRVEKDVLSAVVEPERADVVFEWLYREGRVPDIEGRFLFVVRLSHATPYHLPPGVPEEA